MRSNLFNIDVDALLENYNNNFSRFLCHYISISKTDQLINYPQQLLMGISQNDILMSHIMLQDTVLPTVILEEIKIFKKPLDKNGT
jgi:hypothetical protein